MRPTRRRLAKQRRKGPSKRVARRPPAQSRLTVPRVVAALRRSRDVLTDIEGQLGALLGALDSARGVAGLDRASPDQLARSTREAALALSSLSELRRLLPQAP